MGGGGKEREIHTQAKISNTLMNPVWYLYL